MRARTVSAPDAGDAYYTQSPMTDTEDHRSLRFHVDRRAQRCGDRRSVCSHDCCVSTQLPFLTKAHFPWDSSFTPTTKRAPPQRSTILDSEWLATPVSPKATTFSRPTSDDRPQCQGANPPFSSSPPSDTTKRRYFPPNGIRLVTVVNNRRTFSSAIQWTGLSGPPRLILGLYPRNSHSIGSRADAMRP